jgi:hypothetical protein
VRGPIGGGEFQVKEAALRRPAGITVDARPPLGQRVLRRRFTSGVSVPLEDEAVATGENEATQAGEMVPITSCSYMPSERRS